MSLMPCTYPALVMFDPVDVQRTEVVVVHAVGEQHVIQLLAVRVAVAGVELMVAVRARDVFGNAVASQLHLIHRITRAG